MKRIGFILLLFTSSVGFAQKYAVKTNLAYWATTTLNIGGEIALAPRMTLDMTANYNPFHFRGNKKICIGRFSRNGVIGLVAGLWGILSEYMHMEENITVV